MLKFCSFASAIICLCCPLPAQTVNIAGKKCTAPQATYTPDPPPSHHPRQNSALTVVYLLVDEDGRPRYLKVARSSGNAEFDHDALVTIAQWRFKPAMREGKPIAVHINVEVGSNVTK